ncbi:MAG: ABC transporter permease [Anaerolineae bacterium]|nr:ABC transporter permease [Anaerolineae bacterium]
MRKILALTWKEVYLTFSDRSLLMIMLAAPLAIATIVGLAFGGLGGSGLSIDPIPVGIVNLDAGTTQQGQTLNFGAMFASILVPGAGGQRGAEGSAAQATTGFEECPLAEAQGDNAPSSAPTDMSLEDIVRAEVVTDIAAGRALVESGEYVALIIIPEDFSARLSPRVTFPGEEEQAPLEPTFIEVYASSGSPVSASIIRSIVQGFTNQLRAGNIAIGASINALLASNPLAAIQLNTNADATAVFSCAFSGALNTITIDREQLATADREDGFDYSLSTEILVSIGAAQAVLFALFSGQFGVLGILEERKQGTLQRMITTPTSRRAILSGNLLGMLVTIVVQITLLLIALMLVASLIEGRLALIWGTNLPAIALLTLALALSVAGLGVLIVGIARTQEQVSSFGMIFNMLMGIVGGAFGFPAVLPFGYISPIYWGVDGFNKLARGSAAIGLNVVVLLAGGLALFALGSTLFNRRLDV